MSGTDTTGRIHCGAGLPEVTIEEPGVGEHLLNTNALLGRLCEGVETLVSELHRAADALEGVAAGSANDSGYVSCSRCKRAVRKADTRDLLCASCALGEERARA